MAYIRMLMLISALMVPLVTQDDLADKMGPMVEEAANELPEQVAPTDTTIVRPADMPLRPMPEEVPPPPKYLHI